MRLILQFTLFLALLVSGIIVGTQNSTLVDLNFFGRVLAQQPLWMILLAAFAVGAVTSLLFCLFEILRLWSKIFGLKKKLKQAGVLPGTEVFAEADRESTLVET